MIGYRDRRACNRDISYVTQKLFLNTSHPLWTYSSPAVRLGLGKHVILIKDPTAYGKVLCHSDLSPPLLAHSSSSKPSHSFLFRLCKDFFSFLLLFRRYLSDIANKGYICNRNPLRRWHCARQIFHHLPLPSYLRRKPALSRPRLDHRRCDFRSSCDSLLHGSVFQCHPINGAWDRSVEAKCMNVELWSLVIGIVNVCLDFGVLFLPIGMVWGVQMKLKWKLQVVGIFMLGGL